MKLIFFDCQLFCSMGSIARPRMRALSPWDSNEALLLILRAHDWVAQRANPGNLDFDNVSR